MSFAATSTLGSPRLWPWLLMTILFLSSHVAMGEDPPLHKIPPPKSDTTVAPARDVFDLLDANHDGRMDREEFQQAVDQFEHFLRHNPNSGGTNGGWWWFGSAKPPVTNLLKGSSTRKDLSFWNGFTSAVAMIVATEIGDKTFFIAAVLSMKNDRRVVFAGAMAALILMTVLSTLMGLVLPQFLDRKYTHLLAAFLFGYFGLRLLYEAQGMAANKVSEELEEVEEELLHTHSKKAEGNTMDESSAGDETENDNNSINNTNSNKAVDPESLMRNRSGGVSNNTNSNNAPKTSKKKKQPARRRHHRQPWHMVLFQAFMLTFVAEWGDRSQIATIALAAAKNPIGVTIGGCLGHSFCTGMAVIGGRMLAARISEKTVHQWGGILFLCFAFHSLFFES